MDLLYQEQALIYQGYTYTDSKIEANLFANYFSSIFTDEDTSHIPSLVRAPLPSISPLQIHADGITHLCKTFIWTIVRRKSKI